MPYLHLHAAVLAVLAGKGMPAWSDDSLQVFEKNMHAALEYRDFVDLEGRSIPETGTWGLRKWDHQETLKGL